MTHSIRTLVPADLPRLLALNNAAVPAVSELDAQALAALVQHSHLAVAVVADDAVDVALGFAILFVAGAEYASENYRWFSSRSNDFLYVDRIVVADGFRGQGLGQVLYDAIFGAARRELLAEVLCEVNLEPPNPGSLAFHDRLGFLEVGQLSTKGDTLVVSLLAASV
ncbi:MAG: GNAT family N-acetyltransferase [Cryobacterium sp.]|uniref:GNAT family N-acetyltransferase n=1 Tax=unclassified Cryobacterium TaxID=2649013 RepID=UPI0018CB3083|nr:MULTISPECIES: GNAT family N-acetyltransferase [unclassified Cryobacterium]MCY7405597.1 GNAT family N-acetyltransferase [Cryobacterium sp.]MEC5154377.1 putative GNAT superfamily acetyltransferase [Cryobacterium sp. CAN_C3]